MTVRTVLKGGSDWSDGDILDAADLNDTMNVSGLVMDSSTSDATEFSQANDTWTEKKELTFTPNSSNNVILAIKLAANMKVTGGSAGDARARMTIVGFNGGTITTGDDAGTTSLTYVATSSLYGVTTSSPSTTRVSVEAATNQSTYTIKVFLREQEASSDTAFMKDIVVTIFYLDNGKLTTSSAKFS